MKAKKAIISSNPPLFKILFREYCTYNKESKKVSVKKHPVVPKIQVPSQIKEMVDFIINAYVRSLQKEVQQYSSMVIPKNKDKENGIRSSLLHSTFSPDLCVKLLTVLCAKFPLLTPYVI